MACNDVVSAILHYKRNIDKICDPPERALKYEDRILHCINKLYKLPVNVNHLQETGIGRTVNSLRKIEGEKGLGDAAKALVAKWKTMVMLEDEAERKEREECTGPSAEDLERIKIIREAKKAEMKKTEMNSSSHSLQSTSGEHKKKSKSLESEKKHKKDSSFSHSKSKKRSYDSDGDNQHPSKRRETSIGDSNAIKMKFDTVIAEEKNIESKSKSQSSQRSSSSSSKSIEGKVNKKSSSSERYHDSIRRDTETSKKRDSTNSNFSKSLTNHSIDKHDSSSNEKHKSKNKKKSKELTENDGFDSQSGASFADALGSMAVKKANKKKGNHTNSSITSPAFSDNSSDNGISANQEKQKETKDVKELLFSQARLEPLEPDLMATLPTPTPYYKPHPSYVPSQEAVRKRVQAEEDALTTIMSNKNTRTKVYSGVKGGLLYVPSLYECCCRVLQQHIDALEYTGGIPFSLLKPVLEGATPSQLFQFEHFNPYIIEDTDDLWKFHVNKEFRGQTRQELESWRDMYLRCIDEREEKYKAVTANIIQRTIENSVPVRKAKLAYIDVAKPPRNILKKQMKNGTGKPDVSRLLGKSDPEAVRVPAPKQPSVKEPAVFKVKPKVAPLMQKTLKSIKMSRFKR